MPRHARQVAYQIWIAAFCRSRGEVDWCDASARFAL